MGRYTNQTPVIFRKWKPRREFGEEGGDIIALFPAENGTNDPYTCSSYEHVGQHGSADPVGVIQQTVPAKPAEYADLMKELKGIGYNDLKVYQKLSSDFLTERRRKLSEIENPSDVTMPGYLANRAGKFPKPDKIKTKHRKSAVSKQDRDFIRANPGMGRIGR